MDNWLYSQKEHFDKKIIDSASRKIAEDEDKELRAHFVYASDYYFWPDKLRSFILQGMKKYKIKSVMVTKITLHRNKLITKEVMEKFCKGEKYKKVSVNDDLESLFEDLRLGQKPKRFTWSYFFPKLTKEEMELVEKKDASYLQTFHKNDPDVKEAEMMASESDSKFVDGSGWRATFTMENSSSQNIFNCFYLQ